LLYRRALQRWQCRQCEVRCQLFHYHMHGKEFCHQRMLHRSLSILYRFKTNHIQSITKLVTSTYFYKVFRYIKYFRLLLIYSKERRDRRRMELEAKERYVRECRRLACAKLLTFIFDNPVYCKVYRTRLLVKKYALRWKERVLGKYRKDRREKIFEQVIDKDNSLHSTYSYIEQFLPYMQHVQHVLPQPRTQSASGANPSDNLEDVNIHDLARVPPKRMNYDMITSNMYYDATATSNTGSTTDTIYPNHKETPLVTTYECELKEDRMLQRRQLALEIFAFVQQCQILLEAGHDLEL
jgi:hypothetical protein